MTTGNGISTTNLDAADFVDELVGNVNKNGILETKRVPLENLAKQLASQGALSAFLGVVGKKTLTLLQAVSDVKDGMPGHVYDDPDPIKNGIYTRESSTWLFQRAFPDTSARLTVISHNSPNDVSAITRIGVSPANIEMFIITPLISNTGPVTLRINGLEEKPIKNINGEELLAGEWSGERVKLLSDQGNCYQLLQDPDVEALSNAARASAETSRIYEESSHTAASQAETARDIAAGYASDAISQGNVPLYSTHTGFHALSIPAGIQSVYLWGFYKNGDGGGKAIKRINGRAVVDPTWAQWVRSSDRFMPDGTVDAVNGGWWEIVRAGENLNILQFGAKPELGFDNRPVIQNAINFVCSIGSEQRKPVLRIPDGQFNYTGQLFIPYSALQFMIVGSDVLAATLYRSVPENTAGIIDQGYMTTYRGWTLAQAENTLDNPANIGVLVKRPLGSLADIDVTFQDFRCTRFYYAMETWGRGVRVANCGLNLCRWAINLEWPSVGDYIEGDQPVQKDLTGFRAINIHGNRFHSNLDGGVRNAGANAHKISGVQCYGNHMDIGRTLWNGVLRRAIVYGNTINMTTVEAFNLTDGSREYHIFGNQIAGDINAGRTPNSFYRLSGNHNNFRIENEILSDCKEHGFNIRDGLFTGGLISGITFVRPCSNGDTFCPITIIGENNTVDIDGITLITDQTLTGIVRGTHSISTIRVGRVRTIGNNTPKTVGSTGVRSAPSGEIGLDSDEWWVKLTRSGGIAGGFRYASAGTAGMTLYSSGSLNLESASASIRPMADNTYNLGTSLYRFAQVFAGTGTINTSDEREKQLIGDIPDAWLDAWADVQWGRFKFTDGVRWHIGLIAQQVRDAFLNHGIDAFAIGLLCLDEWHAQDAEYDENGIETLPAISQGDRYGIRYSEAEAMEAAWQRREIARLKQMIMAR